jgi:hypothetical protein
VIEPSLWADVASRAHRELASGLSTPVGFVKVRVRSFGGMPPCVTPPQTLREPADTSVGRHACQDGARDDIRGGEGVALDAVRASGAPHAFLSVSKQVREYDRPPTIPGPTSSLGKTMVEHHLP